MPSRRFPSLALGLLMMGAVSACNCGTSQKVIHTPEDWKVVPGSPSVDPNGPKVEIDQQPPPITYGINKPRQCDIFVQNTVRKVDILWVIQNSGSMGPHQAQLAANFQSFVSFLLSADPPIDFHIGVVSTDTDSATEQGKLHGWNNAVASANYIGCDQTHACNTAPGVTDVPTVQQTVEDAFTQMSNVGTAGSPTQRGLYASYLALNRPENLDNGSGQGFVRSDAALYVVYVGSEDDLSCAPYLNSPPPPGVSCDTFDEECRCADDASVQWGTTDFYERFLENYKGYGHGDLVAAAAVVATEQTAIPNPFVQTTPVEGCDQPQFYPDGGPMPPLEAAYGKRYIEVANATGGASTSICSSNFNDALNRLGFAVSGLRRDFKLTRGPDTNTITVYESKKDSPQCVHDTDCAADPDGYVSCQAGRCAKPISESEQPSDDGAQYIRCDNGVLRNVVEFGSTVVPPAQGTVEVCYDVDAHFSQTCQ